MFYRFLHITWHIFWNSILVLLATVILFAGAVFLMLQTDPARDYLTDRAETWFNNNFEGTLHIGDIGGFLPLQMELRDLVLEHEDRTIVTIDNLRLQADLIALLRSSLVINDLALQKPTVYLRTDEQGDYTLSRVFNRIQYEQSPESQEDISKSVSYAQPFRSLEIYAPFVRIEDGTVHLENLPKGTQNRYLSEPFRVEQINTEMFLEISRDQRYLDISYLTILFEDLDHREFTLSGQIYNDSRYLEFNVMRMRLGRSHLDWNMEFDGINLFAAELARQFRDATWSVAVKEAFLAHEELAFAGAELPSGFPGIVTSFDASGSDTVMNIRDAGLHAGETGLHFDAALEHFLTPENLIYMVDFRDIRLHDPELAEFIPGITDLPMRDWQAISALGSVRGNTDTLYVDLDIGLPEGSLKAGGTLDLALPMNLELSMYGDEINPAAWKGLESFPGLVNTELILTVENILDNSRRISLDVDLFESRIAGLHVPDMHLDLVYADRIISHEFGYYQGADYINGKGSVNLQGEWPHVLMRGNSSGFDMSTVLENTTLPESEWNMAFDINWHGRDLSEWYGRIIVDVFPSAINGSDLGSHQLYLDLNHPESTTRSVRLTSSIADFVMEGDFLIPSIPPLFRQWSNYFVQRFNEEILFQIEEDPVAYKASEDDILQADVFFEIKNLPLLRAYIPQFPEITSRLQLEMDVLANNEILEIRSEWLDDSSSWNGLSINNSSISFTGGFHHDLSLRDAMKLDLDLHAGQLHFMEQNMDSLSWIIAFDSGEITSRGRIAHFANEVRFATDISGRLGPDELLFGMESFVLGNQRYLWATEGRPLFRYSRDGKLHVEDFLVLSGNDRIFIDGTFSSNLDDSVQYRFDNVDLQRFSEMIDGKVSFQGLLDGDFVTRSLAMNPLFHGKLTVDKFSLNDRVIGDISLNSSYNAAEDRFDTEMLIITDEQKYADYIESNNGRRQNVTATGWFRAPDVNEPVDSLYYFDIDAKELDAWVLRHLMDSIFESIEGSATGSGYFKGNIRDFDFHGDFEILEAEVVPVFMEPLYYLDGHVSVNRHEGVTIHELNVSDVRRGRGVVTGYFDFNDFQPEKFMDITLEMENLRFLDNRDGPEIPFYGRVSGTGVVNISGSNISPFVRTVEPITTTSQSRLSLPLVGQSVDEAQGRFIRFVKDFSEVDFRREIITDPAILRQIDRTFMEVFRMDLQFIAGPNSTVQLIFDPVTGEIVNAQGSGRVRISLEDEDLQIFGNFDISSGDYLFVGGDILTRRFILRDGGTIRFEGDPTNALLDITAVYRSRPNIAPLLGAAADQTNRVPVELLLRITGPLDNIENDFYFEFPNAIDATQNAAVLNVLNSEEQKLIQATSLLFTGGFISGALVGDTQTQELGTTLQARAGQVGISQLLSSQINTLLSDNLLNVDVDLNLLGFDQADLAIALRLFDDRLVLRREGEVGGEEANIGDLGATYRINPNLSVEVFHRKDPMLMSILGTQADVENVNGLGLEAQFRFNSWREFGNRVWRNVTTVFGLLGSSEPESAGEQAAGDDGDTEDQATADDDRIFGIREEVPADEPPLQWD